MPVAKKNIVIPVSVFETAETKEDLEDWLMSHNPEFLKRMRKARRDDIMGNFLPDICYLYIL